MSRTASREAVERANESAKVNPPLPTPPPAIAAPPRRLRAAGGGCGGAREGGLQGGWAGAELGLAEGGKVLEGDRHRRGGAARRQQGEEGGVEVDHRQADLPARASVPCPCPPPLPARWALRLRGLP